MGKVTWGGDISADAIDEAERRQFQPYDGPVPPNALYAWKIKMLKKGKAKSSGNDQLIIGLELAPRTGREDQKPYKGYYRTTYIAVVDSQAGKLAGFLDAIGVTAKDFLNRMYDDGEKDARGGVRITKIGDWVNDGNQYVLGELNDDTDKDGRPTKRVDRFWPPPNVESKPKAKRRARAEEDSFGEDDADDADEPVEEKPRRARRAEPVEDDADEAPPRRKAKAKRPAADVEPEYDDEPPF